MIGCAEPAPEEDAHSNAGTRWRICATQNPEQSGAGSGAEEDIVLPNEKPFLEQESGADGR
jgi:hypothetical protein